MEAGEFMNEFGKRVRVLAEAPGKRRRAVADEPMEEAEELSHMAVQLLRKPQLEAFARKQAAAYHQQLWELEGCYACRRR